VPNTYKEAAWRLFLNGFPTAAGMHNQQHSPCEACGVLGPDVGHHFWSCPIAVAVRSEIEGQLRAHQVGGQPMLPVDGSVLCSALWLGVKPYPDLHRMVWDMVCLAAVHAMDVGRCVAWSITHPKDQAVAPLPLLAVERVAGRAAIAAFWDVLGDFAATAILPRTARTVRLTQQPFLSWSVVLVHGSGLRVVRR
jgi:hypothetical protein